MRRASTRVRRGAWGAAIAAVFGASVVAASAGCSAGEPNATRRASTGDPTSGAGGSGDVGGGSGTGAGTGGTSSGTGAPPPIISVPDAGRDGALDPDAACTGEV